MTNAKKIKNWRDANPGETLTTTTLQAILGVTDLQGVDLRSADLSSADLISANLDHADLSNASLSGACMQYASIDGANLTGADLTCAYMPDANERDIFLHGVYRGSKERGRND